MDVIREQEDKDRQEREEKEKLEKEAEAIEKFQILDRNQDGQLSKDEVMSEIAFDQNNDGLVNEEEALFYLSGHESYDQETFVNTGWLLMKHLFSKFEKEGDDHADDVDEAQDDSNDYDDNYDDVEDVEGDREDEDDLQAPNDDQIPSPEVEDVVPNPEEKPKSQYSPEVQALIDSANVARDEYNAANNAYNDMNHDIQVCLFFKFLYFRLPLIRYPF